MEGFDRYKTCYAYVRATGDSTDGRLEVFIYNAFDRDVNGWDRSFIHIYSQIGCGDEFADAARQRSELYARRYGVRGREDQMSLRDLEIGVRFMRLVEKRLAKIRSQRGEPETFAELCFQVMKACEVEIAFFNPNFGTGYDQIESLPRADMTKITGQRDALLQLQNEEEKIVTRYSRKAA